MTKNPSREMRAIFICGFIIWSILICTNAVLSRDLTFSPYTLQQPDIKYTELHRSAEQCDMVGALVALKALPVSKDGINLADRQGCTPLSYAARVGCLDIVMLLITNGASIDLANKGTGWTPLHYAALGRRPDVVSYLIDHGANPNLKTRMGYTPASLALSDLYLYPEDRGDRAATLKVLLEKGADVSSLLERYDIQQNRIAELEKECDRLKKIISQNSSSAGKPSSN